MTMPTNQLPWRRRPPPHLAAGLGSRRRVATAAVSHRILLSRKRRTLKIMTGMTAMKRITRLRCPGPRRCSDEEPLDHALGDDLGLVGLDPGPDHEDDVEDLHGVDHHVGGHHHDRPGDAGHDDPTEHLQLGRPVDAGRLDDLVGDRLDGRRQHDHGEAHPDPDHDHHEQQVVPRLLLQPRRGLMPSPA